MNKNRQNKELFRNYRRIPTFSSLLICFECDNQTDGSTRTMKCAQILQIDDFN